MPAIDKQPDNSRIRARNMVSFALLVLIYLVCSLRYFPGRAMKTLVATGTHLLTFAPFLIGGTIIVGRVFRAFAGINPPKMLLARIFLTLGLIAELFAGIYHYLKYSS